MHGYALPNGDRRLVVERKGPELEAPASRPIENFADVFQAQAAYVLRLLRRLGVREADVEDVAQEVFLVVHARLPAFEGRSTLKTWICGICLRKTSEYRRKAYRRREHATASVSEQPSPSTQERQLEQNEQAALLKQGLTQLSEKQLQVFVLYEIEELPMAEVARAIGCPRFTAYTRLHAARRVLRAFLGAARTQGRLA